MSRSFWRDRCCPPSSGGEGNELATERPWPVLREAAHGIQSAIAHEIGLGRKVITPKHMRTSIELSRADQGGLALLLIAKGVFTAEEYAEAMRLAANTELAMREAEHPGNTFR
jgi:hypothetical protein